MLGGDFAQVHIMQHQPLHRAEKPVVSQAGSTLQLTDPKLREKYSDTLGQPLNLVSVEDGSGF